jgi:hypothetical protein
MNPQDNAEWALTPEETKDIDDMLMSCHMVLLNGFQSLVQKGMDSQRASSIATNAGINACMGFVHLMHLGGDVEADYEKMQAARLSAEDYVREVVEFSCKMAQHNAKGTLN